MQVEFDWLAAERDMLGWIREIVDFGIRRPGSAADLATEQWLLGRFRQFGMTDIRAEPVPVHRWTPARSGLHFPDSNRDIPCFPIPYTAWTNRGIGDLRLVYVKEGAEADFAAQDIFGRLVVAEMRFGELSAAALRHGAHFIFDPEGTIPDGTLHAANWLITNFAAYYRAQQRQAAGFLGILSDSPVAGAALFVPYDGYLKALPGAWVGREDGSFLIEQARCGANVQFESAGSTEVIESHNVVGVVPGSGDESMIVSCHHDAPFASAVEDGSGLSVLLWLARHFVHQVEQLDRSLVFVASSGHFHGGVGNRVFVKRHRDGLLRRTVAALGVEHVAEEAEPDGMGSYRLTGRPEVRAIFVDQNPRLLQLLRSRVPTWGLERTMAVQPYLFGSEPPCDTAPFFTAGIPSICHISGPLYLFDPHDTIEKVRAQDLPRVAGLFADLIRALDGVPAAELEVGLARRREDPPPGPPPWFLPPEVFLNRS